MSEAHPASESAAVEIGPTTLSDVVGAMWDALGDTAGSTETKKQRLDDVIRHYLAAKIAEHKIANSYNLLVLHDEGAMVKTDADRIYTAVSRIKDAKPLLLVLYSTGGSIGTAYLIGQLCREYAFGKLVVVVPRQAKSAATLLSCAADEIHMGSLSELARLTHKSIRCRR